MCPARFKEGPFSTLRQILIFDKFPIRFCTGIYIFHFTLSPQEGNIIRGENMATVRKKQREGGKTKKREKEKKKEKGKKV